MNPDIRPIIDNWPYRSGKISVRKITGDDGQAKIQMRLDLGLLQMEAVGRPDGERPNGFDTLYDYFSHKLGEYKSQHLSDIGFELSADDCRRLRDEALMYYHRYLASFILEDYERVLADTKMNLEIFDLCAKYASKKSDRMVLEQYRPYVIMMNTRAKAHLATRTRKIPLALKHVRSGLKAIKKLYDDIDQSDDFAYSPEATILRQLAQKLRRKLPGHPLRVLEKKLQLAVEQERFEEAANLRNQLNRLKRTRSVKNPPRPDEGEERDDDLQP